MKLEKIIDSRICQMYSITDASPAFREEYPHKFIVITIDPSGPMVENVNELNVEDMLLFNACTYIFTYKHNISKRFIEGIDECDKWVKYTQMTNTCACLDRYYIDSKDKINVIMSVFPRYNIVSPAFNNNIVIRASSKKLNLDALGDQICEIVNETLAAKVKNSTKVTTEEWLRQFIASPFVTPMQTCCIYPKTIEDKTFTRQSKCKITDLVVLYDVRAKNYNEEFKLYSAIGEAFDKKNSVVTVYDSYNGCLSKIKDELDKHKLSYSVLNSYSISTKYENLKKIDVTYQLTDFI
jgi:hypothetical protein